MRLSERAAVTLLFFLNGVIFSSLFARLPAIKESLGVSDGALGLALLCLTGGLVISQPFAGALAAKRGSRTPALAGLAVYALGPPVAGAAGTIGLLALTLFLMGFASGVLDVAMNVEGVAVERRLGRRALTSMHAFFSFGGMTGAGMGGLAAGAGVGVEPHLAVMTVVVLGGGAVAARGLPTGRGGEAPGRAFARPSRALFGLAALAFCVLLAEGSVTDWSAVFLNDQAGASEAVAAAGLTVFSVCMALSRLGGDRVAERLGAVVVIRAGVLLGALGLAAGLVVDLPAPAIVGYAVLGIGLGASFPLVVAAAARGGADDEAAAIAAAAGGGYVGLATGPAVIGLLSNAVGLRQALILVVALLLVGSVLAGSARAGDDRVAS